MLMCWRSTLIVLFSLYLGELAAGPIYKCVDDNGGVTFTDSPCESAEPGHHTETVDIRDSNFSTYNPDPTVESYYEPIVAEPDSGRKSKDASQQAYIEIPPLPSRPAPPRHGTPHMVPSTQGGMVLRTGENSYLDPTTGVPRQGQFTGPYEDPADAIRYAQQKAAYDEAMRQRNIAVEAEKHRAKTQKSQANPMLCAEYRLRLESIEDRSYSRPDSRASAESRSKLYKAQKTTKEKLKAEEKEARHFINMYCK